MDGGDVVEVEDGTGAQRRFAVDSVWRPIAVDDIRLCHVYNQAYGSAQLRCLLLDEVDWQWSGVPWGLISGEMEGYVHGPLLLAGTDIYFGQEDRIRRATFECPTVWAEVVLGVAKGPSDFLTATALAADADWLYWADGQMIGRVWR
jgi:hypothetical protein